MYRHYNPELGQYITPDPIGIAGGLNLYSYTGQNPINYIDPLGLAKRGFGDRWWCYFKKTNEVIPGILASTGTAFIVRSGPVFSRELVTPTLWQYIRSGFRGATMGLASFTALETAIAVGGTAIVQAAYLGIVYEVGVAVVSSVGQNRPMRPPATDLFVFLRAVKK